LAITGVKGYLKHYDRFGPTIAVLGELDAVRSPFHPKSDPETKAVHACGHHAQLAALYGAAIALTVPEVATALDGDVVFFAVPAEEYGEIAFKDGLRKRGLIEYLGGKPELIRRGEFDEIDLVHSHHVSFDDEPAPVVVGSGTTNGFVAKQVRYIGKEAHAAGAPHDGVNALNAALVGLNALNAQRETFRDSDTVRVHPIITKGGDLVNVVPGEVEIEVLVRAKTLEAILDANAKTTRAFEAGAHALGARVEITDLPGYLPQVPQTVSSPFAASARALVGEEHVRVINPSEHHTFSNDLGDVSHLLPVLSFNTGGTAGSAHGADFTVTDPVTAYLLPAKIMALTVYQLLRDGAGQARRIKDNYQPKLTRDTYTKMLDGLLNAK
jgi:amidohydrolase